MHRPSDSIAINRLLATRWFDGSSREWGTETEPLKIRAAACTIVPGYLPISPHNVLSCVLCERASPRGGV